MSKTITDIINGLAVALAKDTAVIAWVHNQYAADVIHDVYVAVDMEHPPVAETAPVVELAQGTRSRNLDRNAIRHQVVIGVYVPCKEVVTSDNLHTRTGNGWANEMAMLCEAACLAWFHDNNILWEPSSAGFPDSSMGTTFRAVWAFDVSVRSRIIY